MTTNEQAAPALRVWDGLTLETRYGVGRAARRNRGHHSGAKLHRICFEVIVAADDAARAHAAKYPNTLTAEWLRRQERGDARPVIFRAAPVCGCTSGQHAALVMSGVGLVTCEKCGPGQYGHGGVKLPEVAAAEGGAA